MSSECINMSYQDSKLSMYFYYKRNVNTSCYQNVWILYGNNCYVIITVSDNEMEIVVNMLYNTPT